MFVSRFYDEGEALRIVTSVMRLLYVMNYLERYFFYCLVSSSLYVMDVLKTSHSHLVLTESEDYNQIKRCVVFFQFTLVKLNLVFHFCCFLYGI